MKLCPRAPFIFWIFSENFEVKITFKYFFCACVNDWFGNALRNYWPEIVGKFACGSTKMKFSAMLTSIKVSFWSVKNIGLVTNLTTSTPPNCLSERQTARKIKQISKMAIFLRDRYLLELMFKTFCCFYF